MKLLTKGLLLFSPFLLYGIGTSITVPLESVAASKEYKSLIGKNYSLNENFVIRGIANNLKTKEISFYIIYPFSSVGGSGPEYVYRGKIPKNSEIIITNVLKSKWSLIAPNTYYVATFKKSVFDSNNKEIRIQEYWFNNENFKETTKTHNKAIKPFATLSGTFKSGVSLAFKSPLS